MSAFDEDFFAGSAAEGEAQLEKAMSSGYATDAAAFTGGRAIVREDCDATAKLVMSEQPEDFKVMNTLRKTPVKSQVHQFNVLDSADDGMGGFVAEGETSIEADADLARKQRMIKFIQRVGRITKQMLVSDTYQNAEAILTLALTQKIFRTAERCCFEGNSAVVPEQFDGFAKQIMDAPVAERNIYDARGKTIATLGEKVLSEPAFLAAQKGGMVNKAFFPLVLVNDVQALAADKIRLMVGDKSMNPVFEDYPTALGTIKIFGKNAGGDKCFRAKGVVAAIGGSLAPAAPASVTSAAAATTGSKFVAADAGTYQYTVHAVNKYGISAGTALAAGQAVAAGDGVTLTITPAATNGGTGFIICRSDKSGANVMELCRIANAGTATTTFVDLNEDLPGTAEMVFITEDRITPNVEMLQLLPLYKEADRRAIGSLVQPFTMAWWGALNVVSPKMCALVKNIAYTGGQTY